MAKRTLPTSLKQITYRDFDIQFRRHPSTGKLLIKKDDDAVKQALKTLILTNFYEKPFFPRFGGNLRARLFDNFDSITAELFKSQIETAIRNFEPRVALDAGGIIIQQQPDRNTLIVTIRFKNVVTLNDLTLDVNLNRIR
jgi:phage baseplate assembly protein W